MNKPMAIYRQGSMEDQERYQDKIEEKTQEYLADPITLIRDNALDFEPWMHEASFAFAFGLLDYTEMGRQLFIRMVVMAKQQATEDVEKG